VAVAFVLLLILFTLALSIVLKPRGGDMPQELSWVDLPGLPSIGIGLAGRTSPSPHSV
jgi:hypothetical protein